MLKDPEIKLFGRKISLPENGVAIAGGEGSSESSGDSSNGSGDRDHCFEENRGEIVVEEENLMQEQAEGEGEVCETSAENEDKDPEESGNTNVITVSDDCPKTPPTDDDVGSREQPKTENGGTNSQQRSLKKPDKILPCPRCKSMDTKFCYYNNYNVNQPRHFCKNCQRYWTAGGTMRNVPVGAGRRKNKNKNSCRHITISEALQAARNGGFNNLNLKPNATATVLSFGSENVSSKSGAKDDGGRNGFQQPGIQNMPPVPCIPWPFPYHSAIFPPGYPLPYYPPPLWNVPLPWLSLPSPTGNQNHATAPSSPNGKHSRSLDPNTPNSSECSIVEPKTLRIDDPEEAAKSSIWSTLGIKYNSISREGLFKALQPKIDEKKAMAATFPLLQANPAALSRSLTFQETN